MHRRPTVYLVAAALFLAAAALSAFGRQYVHTAWTLGAALFALGMWHRTSREPLDPPTS